jgi:hypothetical protein
MASMSQAAANKKPAFVELRLIRMRNTQDSQNQRVTDFAGKHFVPALKRAGAGTVGAFGSVIAANSPFLLIAASYPSMAAIETASEKLLADKEWMAARTDLDSGALPYVRMETSLFRCFDSIPDIEIPPAGKGGGRVFELRTYESNTATSLTKKIGMFDNGEIAIFRKVHMAPVFFGRSVYGANQPNLTYMLAFDSLAQREQAWGAFGADEDWKKLRATPGLGDAEVVSNISNSILRALPFSQVK